MAITLKAMRYFTAAARLGSISRAAAELNVAASAISSAIDQIEAEIGLTLTSRQRSRGIQATADGRVMARKFEALLEDYETVMRDGADLRRSFVGDLRIGYYSPVAPAFLPRLLAPLMDAGNGLTIHLTECDNDAARAGLLSGEFDAILFVSGASEPDIAFAPLIEAPVYCLVSADHAFAARRSVQLSEVAGETIVRLDRAMVSDYYRDVLEQAGTPALVAHTNATEMVRSLVGAGVGCALLNMLPLTETTYGGDRVVAVPIDDPIPPLTLSVGYWKANPRRAVEEFAKRCIEYFDNPGPITCQRL